MGRDHRSLQSHSLFELLKNPGPPGRRLIITDIEDISDIVIMDIGMPGVDGIALIERLSAMDPATAFVLVSADPELQARMPNGAPGAIAAFLSKPLEMLELQETLARAFTLHQRRLTRVGLSVAPHSWSILVVEDSPGDADLVREHLQDVPGVELVFVARLQEEYPQVKFAEASSQVDYIQESFDASMEMLVEGAILAIIVVFLFLWDWRATAVSAVGVSSSR